MTSPVARVARARSWYMEVSDTWRKRFGNLTIASTDTQIHEINEVSLKCCRYKLVKEALRERKYFLDTAPHLSSWLPIMIPIQKWWQAPYFWAGTKAYDFLAGSESIESSYFLTKSKAMEAFPMLRKDNLFGALVYYGIYISSTYSDPR